VELQRLQAESQAKHLEVASLEASRVAQAAALAELAQQRDEEAARRSVRGHDRHADEGSILGSRQFDALVWAKRLVMPRHCNVEPCWHRRDLTIRLEKLQSKLLVGASTLQVRRLHTRMPCGMSTACVRVAHDEDGVVCERLPRHRYA
jgi:hypothetical protein